MTGALGAGGVGLIASAFGHWNYWCGFLAPSLWCLGALSVTASVYACSRRWAGCPQAESPILSLRGPASPS